MQKKVLNCCIFSSHLALFRLRVLSLLPSLRVFFSVCPEAPSLASRFTDSPIHRSPIPSVLCTIQWMVVEETSSGSSVATVLPRAGGTGSGGDVWERRSPRDYYCECHKPHSHAIRRPLLSLRDYYCECHKSTATKARRRTYRTKRGGIREAQQSEHNRQSA